jgi:uncharacterized protein (TIGR03435 family)
VEVTVKQWPAMIALVLCAGSVLLAQAPATFDVVSIKPNTSGDPMNRLAIEPGGRYRWTNTTLQQLIGMSYQRRPFDNREIVGGPDWLASARFDVIAHAGSTALLLGPDGFPGPLFAMVRAMLEDRFQLKTHDEQRERPVYALTLARRDGTLGPRLTRSTIDCTAVMRDQVQGKRPEPTPAGLLPCAIRPAPGRLQGSALSLEGFAGVLSSLVGRPVIDRTGLSGNFDVDLEFTPELVQGLAGAPAAAPPPPARSDLPSVFTAVQEQLGLKLESTRAPVDVLVIDRAERPSDN